MIRWTECDRLDRGYLELVFDEPVSQEPNEQLGAVNAELTATYGTWAEIDWRDEYTCWIWPGKNKVRVG